MTNQVTGMTPDHPNALPLELLPKDWWIWSIRQLHRNPDEDMQFQLERISSVFGDEFLVILMRGHAQRGERAAGTGKSLNEAFKDAIKKIP
jgi:hypothetical protein